jgi:PST family polysaccharide transporter
MNVSTPPEKAKEKLSSTVMKGGAWLGIAAGAQAVLQIVIFAILARLLSPTAFGLAAIAGIIIDVAAGVAPLGISQAVVQRKELRPEHLRAAFTLSLATGCLFAAVLSIAAEPIGRLLGSADSAPLIAALAWMFPIKSLSFVAEGLAARGKKFRLLASRQITAYVLGYGVVGLTCASLGLGAWSLVYAQLTQAAVVALLLNSTVRFPKKPTSDVQAYKDILSFGSGFSAARVINSQSDRAIVSSFTNPAAVGLYSRALQIVRYPTLLVGQVIEDVLFPSFAGVQSDKVRLRQAFYKTQGSIFVAMTPVTALVCLTAGQICDVLLGSQWTGVVPLVIVFGFALPFRSAQRVCSATLRALGHSWWVAALQALLLVATIIGSVIGIRFGLFGAAIAVTIAFLIHYVALLIACAVTLELTPGRLIRHHLSGVPIGSLVAIGSMIGAVTATVVPSIVALIVAGVASAVLTLAGLWVAPRVFINEDGRWLLSLLLSKAPRKISGLSAVSAFQMKVLK